MMVFNIIIGIAFEDEDVITFFFILIVDCSPFLCWKTDMISILSVSISFCIVSTFVVSVKKIFLNRCEMNLL